MTIRAIETAYNGYRFRSRLEARWAVFFDTLKIKYDYEPEGYYLPVAGVQYLPDFWLPQVNMWAEVKPIQLTETQRLKCKELTVITGYPTLMLDSKPLARNYWGFELEYSYDNEGICTLTNKAHYCDYELMNTKRYWEYESRFFSRTGVEWPEVYNCYAWDHPMDCVCETCDPFGAVRAARQARFEHGEMPHPR